MSNVRDYTHRPAAEAAEGTRPAGQAEDAESVSARDLQRLEKRVLFAARDWRVARETTNQREMNEASWALVGAVDKWRNPFSCGKCGHARCEACGEFPCDVDHGRLCDKPAAGVGPPVVAVAGREASAAVERRHREAAVAAYSTEPIAPMFMTRWVESDGILSSGFSQAYRQLTAIAQALADAEAYGRASALEKP